MVDESRPEATPTEPNPYAKLPPAIPLERMVATHETEDAPDLRRARHRQGLPPALLRLTRSAQPSAAAAGPFLNRLPGRSPPGRVPRCPP